MTEVHFISFNSIYLHTVMWVEAYNHCLILYLKMDVRLCVMDNS